MTSAPTKPVRLPGKIASPTVPPGDPHYIHLDGGGLYYHFADEAEPRPVPGPAVFATKRERSSSTKQDRSLPLREHREHRDSEFRRKLSQKAKELRKRKGMSQEDLARRAGIGQSRVSEFESGDGNPTWNTIAAICDGLGTSIEGLVHEVVGVGSLLEEQSSVIRYLSERIEELVRVAGKGE